jgi:hypothetical protein
VTTTSLAAKALLAAWDAKHPGVAPPNPGLTFALMQAIGEGSFTDVNKGTNNWGSHHATAEFARVHAKDKGYGMVAFCDGGPYGRYITRMRVEPSQLIGAEGFLALVSNFSNLSTVQTVADYATDMYINGYFTGVVKGGTPLSKRKAADASGLLNAADVANINAYVGMMSNALKQAQAGMAAAPNDPNDPAAITVGPPFASLAFRLTPAPFLAPHTIEHAQIVVGKAWSNPPPAAISYQDCVNAPQGDGIWLFGVPASSASSNSGGASSTGSPLLKGVAIAGLLAGAGVAVKHIIDHPPRRLAHG